MNNTVERGGSPGGGETDLKREDGAHGSRSEKMCWLPMNQPPLRPGDPSCGARRRPSACSVAQLLASRLRRIGDHLEKSWTEGDGLVCEDGGRVEVAGTRSGRRLKGFLCLAVHVTLLALLGARRHL